MPAASYNLRSVARNLHYLPLPDLIGKTVVMRSLQTAASGVTRQIGSKLPGLTCMSAHDERHIETQIAKHAF